MGLSGGVFLLGEDCSEVRQAVEAGTSMALAVDVLNLRGSIRCTRFDNPFGQLVILTHLRCVLVLDCWLLTLF